MYLVEVVQLNRVIKTHKRTPDYDKADDSFRVHKRDSCREVRMLKVEDGSRILLKYVIKIAHKSGRVILDR